jgi:hypothetical protein
MKKTSTQDTMRKRDDIASWSSKCNAYNVVRIISSKLVLVVVFNAFDRGARACELYDWSLRNGCCVKSQSDDAGFHKVKGVASAEILYSNYCYKTRILNLSLQTRSNLFNRQDLCHFD